MRRSIVVTISVAFLAAVAQAQEPMRARLKPITSPLRHAGVYHVATGRWTRGATLANGTGGAPIYNNSCSIVYFTSMLSTEKWQHRSRLPSNDTDATPAPTINSQFYGSTNSAHRWDEKPGCGNQYAVRGFETFYCTSHFGTLTWTYQFAHSYTACSVGDMIPNYTITVTGMPGDAGQPPVCWVVGIDVSNELGSEMVLSADGNGTYEGPSTSDQFGWSFNVTPATASDGTGPVVAGNFTWTGGGAFGVHTPCTGADGTIWDGTPVGTGPTPTGETEGTGMASNDFFRMVGTVVSAPSGPGCYGFVGGIPHADFYLKLYGQGCGDFGIPMFCFGGVSGIITCPCGNPQIPAGSSKGCNNFVAGGTGGAVMSGSGTAVTNANDTLGLHVTAAAPAATVSVLFQGTTNTVNARSGAGIRCVGGTLKRLYKGNTAAGAINFPNNGVSVHLRSQAVGYTIPAPITLYYYCAYRNSAANGQPGCPGLTFGFNTTNAGSVAWAP